MTTVARIDKRQRRLAIWWHDSWDNFEYDLEEFIGVGMSILSSFSAFAGIAFLLACLDVDYHFSAWMLLFFIPTFIGASMIIGYWQAEKHGLNSATIEGRATDYYNQLSKENKKVAKPLLHRIYAMADSPEWEDYRQGMTERERVIHAMLEKQRGVERQGRKVTFDDTDVQSARFYVEHMYADNHSIER